MKPEEIIRIISCNGEREMSEERIIQAMKEYALSLLPSDEEIKKWVSKYCDKKNETGYNTTILGVGKHYNDGITDLKNEIINKLKS